MVKQLIDYIRRELKKGIPKEKIRQLIIKSGWKPSEVDDSFKSINPSPKKIDSGNPKPEQVLTKTTKEVTQNPVETEKSYNLKRVILLTTAGIFILFIIIYYIYEFIQS